VNLGYCRWYLSSVRCMSNDKHSHRYTVATKTVIRHELFLTCIVCVCLYEQNSQDHTVQNLTVIMARLLSVTEVNGSGRRIIHLT
jgi:hypothetical protein